MTFNRLHLESSVARIECGSKYGSGFALNELRILTARHCVSENAESGAEIKLVFPNFNVPLERSATIIDSDEALDLAVLLLNAPLPAVIQLPLSASPPQYDAAWETYGFPTGRRTAGMRLAGIVSRMSRNSPSQWDVDLTVPHASAPDNTAGLSGAPVVVGGQILAIIQKELDTRGSLGAVSVSKAAEFFRRISIPFRPAVEELPREIDEHTQHSLLTVANCAALEEAIVDVRSGYVAVTGSPGAGKTTFAALFTPRDSRIRVVGRYFVRRPGDRWPISYRANERTIAQWFIDLSAALNGRHAISAKDLDSRPKLIQAVSISLEALAERAGDQVMTLIVDGIDDALRIAPDNRIFSLLPPQLPRNIVIVFTAGSADIFPHDTTPTARQVHLSALDHYTCEVLIRRRLHKRPLEPSDIDLMIRRSEGHALYLRYLVEEVGRADPVLALPDVITSIPVFSGDIKSYYDGLWKSIGDESSIVVALATIARFRTRVALGLFLRTVPERVRLSWPTISGRIASLLEEQQEFVQIYHSSFIEYAVAQTQEYAQEVHQRIWRACAEDPGHPYAAANTLYHRLLGGPEFLGYAIDECTQAWADNCVDSGVSPEFVLADVSAAIHASLEAGNLAGIVRLLLLRQRLHYRYNIYFAQHVFKLAQALIHLGRGKLVSLYLFRDTSLIINEDAALQLVEQLVAAGISEAASALLQLVRAHVEARISTAQGKVAIADILALLNCNQTGITLNDMTGAQQFNDFLKAIMSIVSEQFEGSVRKQIFMAISSTAAAYKLWKVGEYRPLKELKTPAGAIVLPILLRTCDGYLERESFVARLGHGIDGFRRLIADCEALIERDDVDPEYLPIAAHILLRHSRNVSLAHAICMKCDPPLHSDLRDKNGVDPDKVKIHRLQGSYEFAGYCGRIKEPQPSAFTSNNWLVATGDLIGYIGYVSGRSSRLHTEAASSELSEFINRAYELIHTALSFSLKVRSRWHRAYLLPEQILPFVYASATSVFCRFAPDLAKKWLTQLAEQATGQWGLYSEGFREASLRVLDVVLQEIQSPPRAEFFRLAKAVQHHIELGVQNRRERTDLLLRLVPLYCRIGSPDRGASVFASMLATSLGPTWYKEDQLSLVNEVLKAPAANAALEWYVPRAATHLRRAAGEMTFRRYVRQGRESFIGTLCEQGQIGAAIRYYKHCIMPDSGTLIARVRAPGIDKLDEESGYEFGVGEIDEEAGIVEILENAASVEPHIRWAFAELFVVGDDRHVNRYAAIFTEILERRTGEQLDVLVKRFSQFLLSDTDAAFRSEFLPEISRIFPAQATMSIATFLSAWGITLPLSEPVSPATVPEREPAAGEKDDEDELEMPGTFGTKASLRALRKALDTAKTEVEMENSAAARNVLLSALSNLTRGGWSFWSTPISEATDALKVIRSQCRDDQEFLRTIAPLVDDDQFAEDWMKVNKLLELVRSELGVDSLNGVARAIDEHFGVMLGQSELPDEDAGLENAAAMTGDVNAQLVDLLLWYLDYPAFNVKERVASRLEWLCHVIPATVIPVLLQRALEDVPGFSSELAAGILHASIARNSSLLTYIGDFGDFSRSLGSTRHLCIRFALSEVAKIGGIDIPVHLAAQSVEVDRTRKPSEWSALIENELTVIDKAAPGRDVGAAFAANVEALCSPLTIDDHLAADRYIARWSRQASGKWSRFSGIMRSALNCVAIDSLPPTVAASVAARVLRYNPEWPDAAPPPFPCDASVAVRACLGGEALPDFKRCCMANGFLYLHFSEYVWGKDEERESADNIDHFEIICALQDPALWGQPISPRSLYARFDDAEVHSSRQLILPPSAPLVKLYPPRQTIGGNVTPARPHSNLRTMCGIAVGDERRWAWSRERSWTTAAQGAPTRRGCALLVPEMKLQMLTCLRPVWAISLNGAVRLVFNDRGDVLVFEDDGA